MSDPYASNVVLHLPMNIETIGRQTVFDVSPLRLPVDYYPQYNTGGDGSGGLSTSRIKHGNASFRSSPNNSAPILRVVDFPAIGLQDFTIEFWFFCTLGPAWARLLQLGPNSTDGGFWIVARQSVIEECRPFIDTHTGGYWWPAPAQGVITSDTWHHMAVTRSGTDWKIWIDGSLYTSGTLSYNILANTLYLGTNHGGKEYFNGNIDDLRITLGVARYTEAFTPPGAIEYTMPSNTLTLIDQENALSAYPLPAPVFKRQGAVTGTNDLYFGGNGKITGTTKNTPALPVARRVRLHESRSGIAVREGWSDTAGNYSFLNLNRDYTYYVVGFDHTNTYQGVVADKLVPEVM